MVNLRLSFRNIRRAGLKTWLNSFVLSIVFVAMIGLNGIIVGMNRSSINNLKNALYGGGQYWHQNYDPYNPSTIEKSHAQPAEEIKALIDEGKALPIMITQGALYPQKRIKNILIKGIDPEQKILNLPAERLRIKTDTIPALIGTRMAESSQLKNNDIVTLRWRDKDGTFDAGDIKIVHVMNNLVPGVDNGQIWIPFQKLQEMMGTQEHATIVVIQQDLEPPFKKTGVWELKSLTYLLKDLEAMKQIQIFSYAFMYLLLLFMALLAVFDTQVLSIFRRKREIGMLMALGMERKNVIKLFTLEGALHGVLSLIIGAIYATPYLIWSAKSGIKLPESAGDFGMAISTTLYPMYGWKIIIGSALLMLVSVTVVSYFPSRRISDIEPQKVLAGRQE
ncbi:MAG: FtsX-like permease family protein [Candidatus Aminicenantes bacterium]|nr:FtsX-like permease family protein [Candidatus Aminicenantes bacterium]